TVKEFNLDWINRENELTNFYNEIIEAIKFVHNHFKNESFTLLGLGREKVAFNRPIYDLMTYFFSKDSIRSKVRNSDKNIKSLFTELSSGDEVFAFVLTVNTHQTLHTKVRFKLF